MIGLLPVQDNSILHEYCLYAILIESAKEVTEESSRIQLSKRDQDVFLKALDKGPNKALIKAARRFKSVHNE